MKQEIISPRLLIVRDHLLSPLRQIRARLKLAHAAAKLKAGELERVAFHERQQRLVRENSRTRNQQLFAHGANAEIGDYLEVDQYAVRGLEAHPDLYALWMASAASAIVANSRGDLLRHIFADPRRLEFCVSEGLRTSWEFARARRVRETTEFKERQKAGTTAKWRKLPRQSFQDWMIELIERRGEFKAPAGMRRGKAYDWIAFHDGHPDFWTPPTSYPEWELG
jgi:hypothetical protein